MDPTKPYSPPGGETPFEAGNGVSFAPQVQIWRPTPAWPVFAALACAFAMGIFAQFLVLLPLMIQPFNEGQTPQDIGNQILEFVGSPLGMIVISIPMQLAFLLAAAAPARFFDGQFSTPLGLGKPRVHWAAYPILVLSALFPAFIGVALANLVLIQFNSSLADSPMYTQITRDMAGPFTLFIAFAPGVCEEVFFRGFAQRRLTRRYGPWVAIWYSSILFALVHMAPIQVLFVLPIGFWLGYVAWRTDSIWLTIFGHAAINSCWYFWSMISQTAFEGSAPSLLMISVAAIALLSFAASLLILRHAPPGPRAETPPPPESPATPPTPAPIIAQLCEPPKAFNASIEQQPIMAVLAPDELAVEEPPVKGPEPLL